MTSAMMYLLIRQKAIDGDAVIFYAFENYNVGKTAEQVRVRKA